MANVTESLRRSASNRFVGMPDSEIVKDIQSRLLDSFDQYQESWYVDLIDIQQLLDMNSQLAKVGGRHESEQETGGVPDQR